MKPDQPPMYLLNGKFGDKNIECTGYTIQQLQKVSSHEANNADNDIAPVPVEEDRFEFEKILDRVVGDDGELYYRIKWKGYKAKDATWEKRTDLMEDISGAIKAYDKKHP